MTRKCLEGEQLPIGFQSILSENGMFAGSPIGCPEKLHAIHKFSCRLLLLIAPYKPRLVIQFQALHTQVCMLSARSHCSYICITMYGDSWDVQLQLSRVADLSITQTEKIIKVVLRSLENEEFIKNTPQFHINDGEHYWTSYLKMSLECNTNYSFYWRALSNDAFCGENNIRKE